MHKRQYQRIKVQNLVATLSDGVDSFSGTVSDVSRCGMLLTGISQRLHTQGKKLSIIVSAKGKDIKMQVVPKWINGINSDKKMGLIILDAPLDWTVFVMDTEPQNEDIWAETTHLPDC